MKSMLVFFAVCSVAYGYGLLAQPAHLPALVLDARGRPLDTAEVINSRALHLQAKALEGHGHYGYGVHGLASPWVGHSLLNNHYLHKRSLGHWGHAPAAVSHQSRVDVISSPAVVSHAVAPVAVAPVVSHGVVPVANHGVIAGHHGVLAANNGLLAGHHGVLAGHHGALTPINHAAVAPIGLGAIW